MRSSTAKQFLATAPQAQRPLNQTMAHAVKRVQDQLDRGASSPAGGSCGPPQTVANQQLTPRPAQPSGENLPHGDLKRGEVVQATSQSPVPHRRAWRPLTEDEIRKVLIDLSQGATLRQAAAGICRDHSVVRRLIERDADFADQVAMFSQRAALLAARRVHDASITNWRAAAWLLEYLERREQRQARGVTKVKAAVAIEAETRSES